MVAHAAAEGHHPQVAETDHLLAGERRQLDQRVTSREAAAAAMVTAPPAMK